MTSRKKDKKGSDAFRRVRSEQTAGELAMLTRLRMALRTFCEREGVAHSALHVRLADGWPLREQVTRSSYRGRGVPTSETQVRAPSKAWAYNLVTGADDTIPKGDMLWALCERLQLNASWLFTDQGSPDRETARAGGRLSCQELAEEFVAHVLPRCAEIYELPVNALEVQPRKVLALCVDALLDAVAYDAARWRRDYTVLDSLAIVQVLSEEGLTPVGGHVAKWLAKVEDQLQSVLFTPEPGGGGRLPGSAGIAPTASARVYLRQKPRT